MVVETSIESVFQFWFQTQYALPGVLISIITFTNPFDLINYSMLSIVVSFVSISWTAVKIRQALSQSLYHIP